MSTLVASWFSRFLFVGCMEKEDDSRRRKEWIHVPLGGNGGMPTAGGSLTLYWPEQSAIIRHGGFLPSPLGRRRKGRAGRGMFICSVLELPETATWKRHDGKGVTAADSRSNETSAAAACLEDVAGDDGPALAHHAGVIFGGSGTVLLHGGIDDEGACVAGCWVYRFSLGSWEPYEEYLGGCRPPALWGHAAVALPSGGVVLIGPVSRGEAARYNLVGNAIRQSDGQCHRTCKRGRTAAAATAEDGGAAREQHRAENGFVFALFVVDLIGACKGVRPMVTANQPAEPGRRHFSINALSAPHSSDDSQRSSAASLLLHGGSAGDGRLLGDVWILDGTTMVWREVSSSLSSPWPGVGALSLIKKLDLRSGSGVAKGASWIVVGTHGACFLRDGMADVATECGNNVTVMATRQMDVLRVEASTACWMLISIRKSSSSDDLDDNFNDIRGVVSSREGDDEAVRSVVVVTKLGALHWHRFANTPV